MQSQQAAHAAWAGSLLLLLCVLTAAALTAGAFGWALWKRCRQGRQHMHNLWQGDLKQPSPWSQQGQQREEQQPLRVAHTQGDGLLAGLGLGRRDRLERILNSALSQAWFTGGAGSRGSGRGGVEMLPVHHVHHVLPHELLEGGRQPGADST